MPAKTADPPEAGVAQDDADRQREADKPAVPPRTREPEPVADSLFGKIAEVQGELGRMDKDRDVEVRGKDGNVLYSYSYLSESALMTAVKDKLSRRGVAVFVSIDEQRREGSLTFVKVSMTFADAKTGQTFTINGQGQGADTSDKGGYKAITGAVRYMLWKTFLVPTEGDDPNQPHHVNAESTNAPVSWPEVLGRMSAFCADGTPWIAEAVVGFYEPVESFPDGFNKADAKIKYDALRRMQAVVLDLEAAKIDPFADPERTQQLLRVMFQKAFEGLAVAGPDPFVGPVPFS